jgi:hypothetical protein
MNDCPWCDNGGHQTKAHEQFWHGEETPRHARAMDDGVFYPEEDDAES